MPDKPKILLIDDDPQIRRIIRMTLEDDELQLFEADNVIQGLELAESQIPDLILLDIMMPVMDGYEVCARLRSLEATSKYLS